MARQKHTTFQFRTRPDDLQPERDLCRSRLRSLGEAHTRGAYKKTPQLYF
jgi:hypothetical protein